MVANRLYWFCAPSVRISLTTTACLVLVACGAPSRSDTVRAIETVELTGSEITSTREAEGDDAAEGDDEDDDTELRVEIEEAPDAVPGTSERSHEHVILGMRLGERLVRARVESFDLDNAQSGNGGVFSIEMVSVPAGTLVMTHHNLDHFVDPPRFAGSRWSEGWWFPADMQSGERARPMGDLGEQYATAVGQMDGSICISDAAGDVRRYEVVGRDAARVEGSGSCERLVAVQPESVFVQWAGWETSVEYLHIHQAASLGRNLYVLQVAWSDGGQYVEGEVVPEDRSTRLVSADAHGALRWRYLDPRAYCSASMTSREITCGARRFRLEDDRLVRIDR